jgi:hypothetical protein
MDDRLELEELRRRLAEQERRLDVEKVRAYDRGLRDGREKLRRQFLEMLGVDPDGQS